MKELTVVFEPAEELDGWYVVSSPQLPGVLTQGKGFVHALEMFVDAYKCMYEDEEGGYGSPEE